MALSPCHMTMTCKINKLEKPGGQLKNFHTLFGRSAAFYGHFRADTVTSEWSTRISHHASIFKDDQFYGFSRSPYLTAIPEFSSARNCKIYDDVPW